MFFCLIFAFKLLIYSELVFLQCKNAVKFRREDCIFKLKSFKKEGRVLTFTTLLHCTCLILELYCWLSASYVKKSNKKSAIFATYFVFFSTFFVFFVR